MFFYSRNGIAASPGAMYLDVGGGLIPRTPLRATCQPPLFTQQFAVVCRVAFQDVHGVAIRLSVCVYLCIPSISVSNALRFFFLTIRPSALAFISPVLLVSTQPLHRSRRRSARATKQRRKKQKTKKTAGFDGGGVALDAASGSADDGLLLSNASSTLSCVGGGIFEQNDAGERGGAVYVTRESTVTFDGCSSLRNTASLGAAVYASHSFVTLSGGSVLAYDEVCWGYASYAGWVVVVVCVGGICTAGCCHFRLLALSCLLLVLLQVVFCVAAVVELRYERLCPRRH